MAVSLGSSCSRAASGPAGASSQIRMLKASKWRRGVIVWHEWLHFGVYSSCYVWLKVHSGSLRMFPFGKKTYPAVEPRSKKPSDTFHVRSRVFPIKMHQAIHLMIQNTSLKQPKNKISIESLKHNWIKLRMYSDGKSSSFHSSCILLAGCRSEDDVHHKNTLHTIIIQIYSIYIFHCNDFSLFTMH